MKQFLNFNLLNQGKMKKGELLKETHQKIDEINNKIKGLREKILPETGEKIKEKMQAAIEELEDIRDKVSSQYDELVEIDKQSDEDIDKIKKKRDEDVAEIDTKRDEDVAEIDRKRDVDVAEIDRKRDEDVAEIDSKRDEDVAEIDSKRDEDVAGLKKRNERKWTEMEKNVFSSFRSFNESFGKAGTMFKSRRNI